MSHPDTHFAVSHSEATPGSGTQTSIASASAFDSPALAAGDVELLEYPDSEAWSLTEQGFTLPREHEIESLFAIANGYVGNRGSLAEGTRLSSPGTFVAGVFDLDARPQAVPGYLLLPDWTSVQAWVEDSLLCLDRGEVLFHRRLLDMRRGMLWREWRHRDPNGRITRVLSFRLASLADRHLLVQSVAFTPENYSGRMRLETVIELPETAVASPPPEEWKTRRSALRSNVLPLALRSKARGVTVAFGAASQVVDREHRAGHREIDVTERRITERFHLDVNLGAEYRLDRLISIFSSRESSAPAASALAHVQAALPAGIIGAAKAHEAAWKLRWQASDVQVEGDDVLQRALRFAEYHLISAANPEDDRVSIGARALTGESYKGHVFWDTEIYMVPFYTFTDPASARALLMYRFHTLPAARAKAQAAGYQGAMYPWESADTGDETTPDYVIGPEGKVIHVLNGPMEVHITADVAYAVWQYSCATRDREFLCSAGAEIVLEAARFWASRGEMEADGRYHIRHVIGPDEYHEDVDDNAYTNLMAQWNLRQAAALVPWLRQQVPEQWRELAARLDLSEAEPPTWIQLADAMETGFDPRTGIFEQFCGFYRKRHVDLESYEPRNSAMDVILGHDEIQTTDVVKQPDVVMAMFLLWDEFSPEVRAANFRYYEPLTGHGSSLSPAIHALMAARLGEMDLAEKYLQQSAEIDLGNNMGNASGGVHAAAIGGLWQAMVFGFAGVQLHNELPGVSPSVGLTLDPHLLPRWKRLSFPLRAGGIEFAITVRPDTVELNNHDEARELQVGLPGVSMARVGARQCWRARRQAAAWSPCEG